jgi:hypothetical protein
LLVGVIDGQDRVPVGWAVVGVVRRLAIRLLPVVGVIVVAVVMITVRVVTDVEVDVEESGAELAVVVPVTGGVEAEPGKAGQNDNDQGRGRRPDRSDHGSMESSHHQIPR